MRRMFGAVAVVAAMVVAGVGFGTSGASAASSNRCHFTGAQPVLGQGSAGTAVMQAQCELNFAWVYQWGHGGLTEDGQFGPATRAATVGFQTCVGITADGVIGPVTWSWLNRFVASGQPCNDTTYPQG